jgi:hypothetical protein
LLCDRQTQKCIPDERILLSKKYLTKYCKQLGILDVEIPELIFDAEEYKTKIDESLERNEINTNVLESDFFRGLDGNCARRFGRYVFINMDKLPSNDNKQYHLQHLLIHELVHYRFPLIQHGNDFFNLIELIYIGKEYPKQHITCPNVPFI